MGLFYAGQRILASYENQVSQAAPTQIITTTTALVTFSSIPAYNHLTVLWKARGDSATAAVALMCQINGVSALRYTWEYAQAATTTVSGANAGAAVSSGQVGMVPCASATASYPGGGQIVFPYVSDSTGFQMAVGTSTAFETASTAVAGTYGAMMALAGQVNTLTFFPATGNFTLGAFSLYGWM